MIATALGMAWACGEVAMQRLVSEWQGQTNRAVGVPILEFAAGWVLGGWLLHRPYVPRALRQNRPDARS